MSHRREGPAPDPASDVPVGDDGDGPDPEPGGAAATRRLRPLLGDRTWPIIVSVVFILVAWAYFLLWGPVVRHERLWQIPGDIWGTYRAAHYVGWGDIADTFNPVTGMVAPPAIAVLLAPVAMLTGALNLPESVYPYFLAKPSSWIFLGSAVLLLGTTTIFAVNRLAVTLMVASRRRLVLCLLVTAPIWLVAVMWGHPEDCVALTLAIYALVRGFREQWRISGWLWGAAIAFQPFVLLMFPMALSVVPAGQRVKTIVRGALPALALLIIPLTTNWPLTSLALFKQPNYPTLDYPTPWMAVAPRLSALTVGSGPGRLIAVLVAVGLGIAAYRWHPTWDALIWGCAVALSARCVFESVIVPFYLGPPVILCLVAAATRPRRWRLAVTFAAGLAVLIASYDRTGEWPYWLVMTALLTVALAAAWPGRDRIVQRIDPSEVVDVERPGLDDIEVVGPRPA
jgi:hypothetical protein